MCVVYKGTSGWNKKNTRFTATLWICIAGRRVSMMSWIVWNYLLRIAKAIALISFCIVIVIKKKHDFGWSGVRNI